MTKRRKTGSSRSPRTHRVPPIVESLEPRLLLSTGLIPCIDLVEADNRGLVVMHVTADLVAGSVDNQSVQLLGRGADGILGTDDDNVLNATVSYDAATREIRIEADALEADTAYGIRVDGDSIRDTGGRRLDAEFNGPGLATGNGIEGGTLLIYTESTAGNPIARVTTNLGAIDIELFRDQTPLTVANFMVYANRGVWDRSFFHRLVNDFVIQGGGFFAEPGFQRIPQDPAVQNEPGISNLRGTVAMAKLGGNPNSATNEWFFNLNDNSSNLDNQNGGFTVFAEIVNAQGFEILDLLTLNRDIVNASSQNGAFNEVPVLDAGDVVNNQITPEDLLKIERVATLVGLTATPFESLEVAATAVVSNPRAGVGVRLYALDAGTNEDLAGMLKVKFGAGRSIESITIREGASVGRLAIEISGATSVGVLKDARPDSHDLAFIVSSAHIGQINLRGSVLGMDINDVVLPGGTQLEDDIDGDGKLDDAVAIYIPSGFVDTLRVRGDLSGDVIATGGARSLRVDGLVKTTEFRVGNSASPEGNYLSARFNRVDQTSLLSDDPIRTLRAAEWENSTPEAWMVRAPMIVDLQTKGGRGLDGDFNVSLNLNGAGLGGFGVLGRARIAGDINNATWDATAGVGQIRVGGDITQWEANIAGSMASLSANRLQAASLTIGAELTKGIEAWSWNGGILDVQGQVGRLVLSGDRRADDSGDLRGVNIMINDPGAPARMDRFWVAGDVTDVDMTARSEFGSIQLDGMLRNSSIQTAGDVGFVRTGDAREGTLSINGLIGTVTVGDWVGDLFLGRTGRINVNGSFLGDFFTRHTELMVVDGDVEGQDFRFNSANQVVVKGDVINSRVWFEGSATDTSVNLFDIRGALLASQFYATENVGTIQATAMMDSAIYVGASAENPINGFPDENGAGIDQSKMLERLMVLGRSDTSVSFDNVIVAAGRIGTASVSYPEHFSSHAPKYGLAASQFGSVFTRLETGQVISVQNPRVSPPAIGAYQVRVGFDAPAVSS
ncbi:MAG: peptidylprolyl isomerase [Phycisphaerales bacterium]|nr:peptidylprolyl isomerase [Phycisphaerales bacterium]